MTQEPESPELQPREYVDLEINELRSLRDTEPEIYANEVGACLARAIVSVQVGRNQPKEFMIGSLMLKELVQDEDWIVINRPELAKGFTETLAKSFKELMGSD